MESGNGNDPLQAFAAAARSQGMDPEALLRAKGRVEFGLKVASSLAEAAQDNTSRFGRVPLSLSDAIAVYEALERQGAFMASARIITCQACGNGGKYESEPGSLTCETCAVHLAAGGRARQG